MLNIALHSPNNIGKVGVTVGVFVGVFVEVFVGVFVGVDVLVGVTVGVFVGVDVLVGVIVGVGVLVGVSVIKNSKQSGQSLNCWEYVFEDVPSNGCTVNPKYPKQFQQLLLPYSGNMYVSFTTKGGGAGGCRLSI